MSSILDTIVARKKEEVAEGMSRISLPEIEKEISRLATKVIPVPERGIIAEMKRRSPSKGVLRDFDPKDIARQYTEAGAAAISVLTDLDFFGGTLADLEAVKSVTTLPVLRKDFVIDRYQIAEARLAGADIILLIARILSATQLTELAAYAHALSLTVLVETHIVEEAQATRHLNSSLVGVNNRDLKDFTVSLDASMQIAQYIPEQHKKVAESGIHSPEAIQRLKTAGYDFFLVGEAFMTHQNPGEVCKRFVEEVSSC